MNKQDSFSPIKFLASNQLAIYTLIALTVACFIGVLVPQLHVTIEPAELQSLIEAKPWLHYVYVLGFFEVFNSPWFYSLILLLVINLTACSYRGLKRMLVLHKKQATRRGEAVTKGLTLYHSFKAAGDEAEALACHWLGHFGKPADRSDDGVKALFAQRGWWFKMGPYLIHVSLIVVIAGALVGQWAGLRGQMNILEGSTEDTIRLDRKARGQDSFKLPFSVRCDRFQVEMYPDSNRPKEFTSDLVIIRDKHEVLKKTIQVNDPLKYNGFRFFQANYGLIGGVTEVEATVNSTTQKHILSLGDGHAETIPGSTDTLNVIDYRQDHMNAGPAIMVEIQRDEKIQTTWLFQKAPEFDAGRQGFYRFVFLDRRPLYYTGLSVQKDPGVPIVWAGFVLFFFGLALVYIVPHLRAAAVFNEDEVRLYAASSKSGKAINWIKIKFRQHPASGMSEQA